MPSPSSRRHRKRTIRSTKVQRHRATGDRQIRGRDRLPVRRPSVPHRLCPPPLRSLRLLLPCRPLRLVPLRLPRPLRVRHPAFGGRAQGKSSKHSSKRDPRSAGRTLLARVTPPSHITDNFFQYRLSACDAFLQLRASLLFPARPSGLFFCVLLPFSRCASWQGCW
jgi:hypothetical protein